MLLKTIDVDAVAKRVAYQGFTYWGCRDLPISFGWLQKLESHLLDVADAPAQHPLMLEETMNLSSEPDERAAVNRLVFELARIPVECRVFSKDERSVMIEIRCETTSSQFAVGSRYVPQTTFPAECDMETLQEDAVYWFFFTRDELAIANLILVSDVDNNYQNRLSVPTLDEQDSIVHWVLGKTRSEFGIIVSDELYPKTDRLVSETEDGDRKYIDGWRSIAKRSRHALDATDAPKTAIDKILHFIEERGQVTTSEIIAQKFSNDRIVYKGLKKLVEQNKVYKIKRGVYASTSAIILKSDPS